jgi:hypothetical protein
LAQAGQYILCNLQGNKQKIYILGWAVAEQ